MVMTYSSSLTHVVEDSSILEHPEIVALLLHRFGYVHFQFPHQEDDLRTFCSYFGSIHSQTDIKIDSQRYTALIKVRRHRPDRPSIYQTDELGMHTDRPWETWIAWFCHGQDLVDGTLYLLDSFKLLDHFCPTELMALRTIHIEWSARLPGSKKEEIIKIPILAYDGFGYQFSYAPWLVSKDVTPTQQRLVNKLDRCIKEDSRSAYVGIRLQPGESMMLANGRFLHGRGAIAEPSSRHLVRFGIETPGKYTDKRTLVYQ